MAMYSERTERQARPPHLSALRSESSSSNGSHDYESLPSSFDHGRAILIKRDSEDYAKIGPAPADSEEALDESKSVVGDLLVYQAELFLNPPPLWWEMVELDQPSILIVLHSWHHY